MYTKNDKWIRKCILQLASDIYMVTTTTSKGRSKHRRYSTKKLFLKISQYWQENTCVGVSFKIKKWIKRDSNIFKNIYFEKHLGTAGSENE